jgi:hypothetical protein
MGKKAQVAAANGNGIRLHRDLFHPRAVRSGSGGVLANGPFRMKVEMFGSDLIYEEGGYKLTLQVQFGRGGHCVVDMDSIQCWDGASERLDPRDTAIIQRNIFLALDHLRIRCLDAG